MKTGKVELAHQKKNGVDPLKYGPTKTMSEATKVGDSANAQPKRNGQVVETSWLLLNPYNHPDLKVWNFQKRKWKK